MKKIAMLGLILMSSVAMAKHDGKDHKRFKELPPEVKAAFKECHQSLGLEKGQRPSKEQRDKVRECMDAKGFKPPMKPGDRPKLEKAPELEK